MLRFGPRVRHCQNKLVGTADTQAHLDHITWMPVKLRFGGSRVPIPRITAHAPERSPGPVFGVLMSVFVQSYLPGEPGVNSSRSCCRTEINREIIRAVLYFRRTCRIIDGI